MGANPMVNIKSFGISLKCQMTEFFYIYWFAVRKSFRDVKKTPFIWEAGFNHGLFANISRSLDWGGGGGGGGGDD